MAQRAFRAPRKRFFSKKKSGDPMLPVSAWPPRTPGSDLSPFGPPRCVPSGYVLLKGAWVVYTGGASVIQRYCVQDIWGQNPSRVPYTGVLPGTPASPPPSCSCQNWSYMTADQQLEAFRAWQRKSGNTNRAGPPIGIGPPNWFGAATVQSSKSFTLLPAGANGLVVSDGQNTMICGSGAMIMQAYSV